MKTKYTAKRRFNSCGCWGTDTTNVPGTLLSGMCPLHKAAPELLEAAKATESLLRHWCDYGHVPTVGELQHEIDFIQKAISKAEGK